MNITAIIIALNEQEFITKCISAIYSFVTRLFVITNYDTDYSGYHHQPDLTYERIVNLDDPDKKVILLFNRRIIDETIQRNWAMLTDQSLFRSSRLKFLPHAHSKDEIFEKYPQTDYYWIIDADEIYDPNTIPGMIEFVQRTRWDAVLVRGHNFFKTWNYRFELASRPFWQIGFLRRGRYFYSRRRLFIPRGFGLVWRISPKYYERLLHLYCREVKLPEQIAHFYHGNYIGDNERIQKKLATSSHAREIKTEEWLEKVWTNWDPEIKKASYPGNPDVMSDLDYIPTAFLPTIIRDNSWPKGWIELLEQ